MTNPNPTTNALTTRILGVLCIALALSTYYFLQQAHQRDLALLASQHHLERVTLLHQHEYGALTNDLTRLERDLSDARATALDLDAALQAALEAARAQADAQPATTPTPPPSAAIAALAHAEITDLSAQLRAAHTTITTLEHQRDDLTHQLATLTTLHADLSTHTHDLEALLEHAEQQLAQLSAELELAAQQPPPPAPNVAPLPLPNPYSDTVLDAPLEAYLAELLTVIASDAIAPTLLSDHPMSALYRDELEIITQGELGRHSPYRITERYAFNDFGDVLERGLILIDAPAGAPTATLVQQLLTAAFGAPERDAQAAQAWFADTKRFTLLSDPMQPQRLVLAIEDAYQASAVLQIYGRD